MDKVHVAAIPYGGRAGTVPFRRRGERGRNLSECPRWGQERGGGIWSLSIAMRKRFLYDDAGIYEAKPHEILRFAQDDTVCHFWANKSGQVKGGKYGRPYKSPHPGGRR
jgi:hypothetical protein